MRQKNKKSIGNVATRQFSRSTPNWKSSYPKKITTWEKWKEITNRKSRIYLGRQKMPSGISRTWRSAGLDQETSLSQECLTPPEKQGFNNKHSRAYSIPRVNTPLPVITSTDLEVSTLLWPTSSMLILGTRIHHLALQEQVKQRLPEIMATIFTTVLVDMLTTTRWDRSLQEGHQSHLIVAMEVSWTSIEPCRQEAKNAWSSWIGFKM